MAGYVLQTVDKLGSVPYVQLDRFPNLAEAAKLLAPQVCRACKCLVVEQGGGRVKVALVDPANADVRNFLAQALRPYDVQWFAISEKDFELHAGQVLRSDVSRKKELPGFERLVSMTPSGEEMVVAGAGGDDLLARVFTQAIRWSASDIHFEPGAAVTTPTVRLRTDGRMVPIEKGIDPQQFRHAISQLKVMAELSITRGNLPQDGSFTILADDQRLEMRLSTMPCHGGEKAVIRLVAPNPHFSRLENLIITPTLAQLADDIFKSPRGLVLVTGPTGAGKTTTLYAALNSIWREDQSINVVTIEDPVEYNLPFATQVQVNRDAGLNFSNILRSVLRQDPDVILVGEIRDSESASMALEAATTGHLVLSSLHTHSALETLARLRNLQVKPYLLADALQGVISQQLVPRLRPGDNESVPSDDPIISRLQQLKILPHQWSGTLSRPPTISTGNGELEGTDDDAELGRLGVYEVLGVTRALRQLIEQEAPISEVARSLDDNVYASFETYSRMLLEKGLVAPERIEGLFSRIEARHTTNGAPSAAGSSA